MVAKRVLVVDDDEAGRRLMGEILHDAGYECDLAGSATAALELLKSSRPDAMVVDLVMPQVDGFDFLLEARKLPNAKDVPVIVATASAVMSDLTVGTLGVRAAVAKPFELGDLVTVVARVLEGEPAE